MRDAENDDDEEEKALRSFSPWAARRPGALHSPRVSPRRVGVQGTVGFASTSPPLIARAEREGRRFSLLTLALNAP